MVALTDPIGLVMPGLGSGMLNLVQLKIEPVRMFVKPATELSLAISQNAQDINSLLLIERRHPATEGISSCQGYLGGVQLGKSHL
jgi:hypothetical protein